MSQALERKQNNGEALAASNNAALYESLALRGDISGLKPEERVRYYGQLCERLGLDPYTQPFIPLKLSGKEVLYASRGATDQLARKHNLTREIMSREHVEDVYVVTVRATLPDGREEYSTGAVPLGSLRGEALCNALMKAETKAKRRVTLAILGLGMLDESELETIPRSAMGTDASPIAEAQGLKQPRKIDLIREKRGQDIATMGLVRREGDHYVVQTPSIRGERKEYDVWREAGVIRCACAEFVEQFADDQEFRCEHILAVKHFVASQNRKLGAMENAKRQGFIAEILQTIAALNDAGADPEWDEAALTIYANEKFDVTGGVEELSDEQVNELRTDLSRKLDAQVLDNEEEASRAMSGETKEEEAMF